MKKIDFKRELKHLYQPSGTKISVVDVPAMNFLTITGQGNPNSSQAYQEAVEALYSVAYTVKFMVKKGELAIDFGVMPLEGLWWVPDMRQFSMGNKDAWLWQMMIMQPDFVTADMIAVAKAQVKKKKGLVAVDLLKLERFVEGTAVQILYTGPYADEDPTIQKLHEHVRQQGGELSGKHHEIYLSDPRRAAPERLKTVIRQPFVVKEVVAT
ncbi:MAG: GyrI-like domain-containing protein [Ardenticatenaceae bacterium]|nr:GyrI-like domain-containing protein [Anaerolineales bacterium]MCB8941935.1 GyrI-like domain-containing protein [Ardenticatenaceae bacterium]MCB8973048.1 GyrI-like domain-containing protein [Ardenticatenaceae bacterium]